MVQVRREYQKVLSSTVKIQAVAKAFLQIRRFTKLKVAAVKAQAICRALIARRAFTKSKAAIKIQVRFYNK